MITLTAPIWLVNTITICIIVIAVLSVVRGIVELAKWWVSNKIKQQLDLAMTLEKQLGEAEAKRKDRNDP